MNQARFVVRSAFRNRLRSALTVLSVMFCMLLLAVLMTVWRAYYIDSGAADRAALLVVRHRVSLAFLLPTYYAQKIRQVPGVEAVAPMTLFGGRYKDNRSENSFVQFATDPAGFLKVTADDGRIVPAEQVRAWLRDPAGAMVDSVLADRYGWKPGDRVSLKGTYFPADLDLTIRAIYSLPHPDRAMYFPTTYLEERLPSFKGRAWVYYVRATRPEDLPRVAAAIDEMFRNAPRPTRTESQRQFQAGFVAMLGNVKAFILGISLAVVFTILLVTANTMAMSIRERTREVAVLRSLGFGRDRILTLFVTEGVAITLLGGTCGVVAARMLVAWITATPLGVGLPASMSLTLPTAAVALAVAAVMGVASVIVPALHASRMSVVNGLRHIG